ncbi:hypothetical protein ILUMI_16793 [Ignelater luminosus]|uniref:Uncharacterized protein n=1 Tax=Ignelater luminosus TaxID=2038154 RepID=A0A8K0G2I6_IGNLU|nr:hypothetical protein ILUMI_16793 [Ignelater luminosus]
MSTLFCKFVRGIEDISLEPFVNLHSLLCNGSGIHRTLFIQSLNVKIDYLPDRRNVVADTLSRPPFSDLPPEEEILICMVSVTIPGRSQSEVRSQQLEDPGLAKIIHSFEDSDDSDLPK